METSSANFENIHDYTPGIYRVITCLLKAEMCNCVFFLKKKKYFCIPAWYAETNLIQIKTHLSLFANPNQGCVSQNQLVATSIVTNRDQWTCDHSWLTMLMGPQSSTATVAQPIVPLGGVAICLFDQWRAGGVVRNLFENSHYFCNSIWWS